MKDSIFLSRRGLKSPKISKNSTNLDLTEIFRVSRNQSMIRVGDKKDTLPKPKLDFLAKKGVETLQNQPKTQPSQIWLKFSE